MATYTTSEVGSGVAPRSVHAGVVSVSSTFTVSTALAANDVIQMVKVPEGATVLDVILLSDDLDIGGTPAIVLDVGDGSDTNRFITGSTIGQGGGVERMNSQVSHGETAKYSSDDTIDITVATGPATGATGVKVTLTVLYTMDA